MTAETTVTNLPAAIDSEPVTSSAGFIILSPDLFPQGSVGRTRFTFTHNGLPRGLQQRQRPANIFDQPIADAASATVAHGLEAIGVSTVYGALSLPQRGRNADIVNRGVRHNFNRWAEHYLASLAISPQQRLFLSLVGRPESDNSLLTPEAEIALADDIGQALQTVNRVQGAIARARFGLDLGYGQTVAQIARRFNTTPDTIDYVLGTTQRQLHDFMMAPDRSAQDRSPKPPTIVNRLLPEMAIPDEVLDDLLTAWTDENALHRPVANYLRRIGIASVADLLATPSANLVSANHIGRDNLRQIAALIARTLTQAAIPVEESALAAMLIIQYDENKKALRHDK